MVHTCNLRTKEAETGCQELKISLSLRVSSKPAWAAWDPVLALSLLEGGERKEEEGRGRGG